MLASIILVSLLPLIFLGPQIHHTIWNEAQKETTEKHLLIAKNLGEPLQLFVNSHLDSLQMLANTFQQFSIEDRQKIQTLLEHTVNQANEFNTMALVTVTGETLAQSFKNGMAIINRPDYSSHRCFINVINSAKKEVSSIHRSRVDLMPILMMGQPVFDLNQQLVAVLLSEVSLKSIEEMRAKIQFGHRGHSAIFDAKGNIIAHPNADWAREIKNLSKLPIVKKMINGESGVMEFYSPHIMENMVAGFTSVSDIGWGVMVPQPKKELEAAVASILNSFLIWAIIGLLIAVIAAYYLTHWITRPMLKLAEQAGKLDRTKDLSLTSIIPNAPREVVQLSQAMQQLVDDLQASNLEVKSLNDSLQEQITHATSELQAANNNLQHIASSDHLTTIANRRYFETTVSDLLDHRPGKSIGIMLVDIDNFKIINDQYGHAAGDYVLTMVAKLLNRITRPGDVIARYGGDEFVAEFEADVKTIQKRAEELRTTVENYPFQWNKEALNVTLSIGITCHKTSPDSSLDQLMTEADTAMYQAKNAGRNKVAILAS